jgi:hypothetical protein
MTIFRWLQMYLVYAHGVILKSVPLHSLFNWESSDFYLLCILLYKSVSSFRLKITSTFDLATSYMSLSSVLIYYWPRNPNSLKIKNVQT